MMTKIDLPRHGFTDEYGTTITALDVALGQRHEFSTEVFVRGKWLMHGAETRFAGMTVIAEGRSIPEYDLEIGGKYDEVMETALAVAIHLCLDQYADAIVGGEMERICGQS